MSTATNYRESKTAHSAEQMRMRYNRYSQDEFSCDSNNEEEEDEDALLRWAIKRYGVRRRA